MSDPPKLRRPRTAREIAVGQLRRRLTLIINEMQELSSRYDMSNGALRFVVKQLEHDLRDLRRRLRIPKD